ncbi:hypothetical protein AB0K48_00875 [Nonomuraea sp. NPDC055795]
MERWVQSCRHELLDRCLTWNEHHLRHAPREYERFYNQHRAHQALAQAAPLRTVPDPDHGSRANHRPECTPTRPAWRRPSRVLTCRLTWMDVFSAGAAVRDGYRGAAVDLREQLPPEAIAAQLGGASRRTRPPRRAAAGDRSRRPGPAAMNG